MVIDVEINEFRRWTYMIGTSSQSIPTYEVLRNVLKFRQGEMLRKIATKVKSLQCVYHQRMNGLLCGSKRVESSYKADPAAFHSYKEINMYDDFKYIMKTEKWRWLIIKELASHTEKLTSAKTKNIYKIQLKHKIAAVKAKRYMCRSKHDLVQRAIEEEEEHEKCIFLLTPCKSPFTKSDNLTAVTAMNSAKNYLEDFSCINKSLFKEYCPKTDSKSHLWLDLHSIFAQIPNWMLWIALVNVGEHLSWDILEFAKADSFKNNTLVEKFSSFDLKFLEIRSTFLNIILQHGMKKGKEGLLSQNFIAAHESLMNRFEMRFISTHAYDTNRKEIIAEYLEKSSFQTFCKKKAEFFNLEISTRKRHLGSGETLENHQLLLNKVRTFYTEITTLMHKIKQVKLELAQIKQKTIFSKKSLHYLLNANICNGKQMFKKSVHLDSFEISDVLCSTKLDLESSLANSSLRPDTNFPTSKSMQTVQCLEELIIFSNWCANKIRCINSMWSCDRKSMDLISINCESFIQVQLSPLCALTFLVTFEDIDIALRRKRNIVLALEPYTMVDYDVNMEHLENLAALKKEMVNKLLDSITRYENVTEKKRRLTKIYNFVLKNYLHKCVPLLIYINNRIYADYYSEFETYGRML